MQNRILTSAAASIPSRDSATRFSTSGFFHETVYQYTISATSFVDTGGKFATSINNTSSTGEKFAAGVVDTCGKFATGVVDTSGKLPLVLLIPVMYLSNFRKKFVMTLMLFSGLVGR
jgi:hypothetical protein